MCKESLYCNLLYFKPEMDDQRREALVLQGSNVVSEESNFIVRQGVE